MKRKLDHSKIYKLKIKNVSRDGSANWLNTWLGIKWPSHVERLHATNIVETKRYEFVQCFEFDKGGYGEMTRDRPWRTKLLLS